MYEQLRSELSPELQLIVYACQSRVDPDKIRKKAAHFHEDNYQHAFSLARRHGVLPLLYQALTSTPDIPMPSETQTFFKHGFMGIVQHNMLMSAELTELMRLFEQSGIKSMAFKGPALAEMAYGSITLRQYGDLDILIKREDLQKSLTLLQERGYTPEIELPKKTLETFYSCVNVIGLHRGGLRVEIHWELLSRNYAVDWDDKKLWSDAQRIEINRRAVTALSFENHILYLCVHGCKHQFERLEWICDIDRALRANSEIDWKHLSAEADALGIQRMLLIGLNLARLFFDLPLPGVMATKIEADPAVEGVTQKVIALHYTATQKPVRPLSTFLLLWQMREKRGDRLRFAYRALFAPKFDDFSIVKLPKQLLFLYPFIRPVRLLLKSISS